MISYSYKIYDFDVGSNVYECPICGWDTILDEALPTIDYDFASEAEFEDDPNAFLKELIKFKPNAIKQSLLKFNFANGFCEWRCILPGHHRMLCVSMNTH